MGTSMASIKKDPKITLRAEDKTAKAFKGAQHNLRNLASSAAILEGPLGAVAGRINTLGAAIGRMNPTLLLAGVSFAALSVAVVSAMRNGTEMEQQMLRVEAVIKATGGAAGFSAEQISEMSLAIAEGTLASQEGARNAAIKLLSFSKISGDVFKRTLAAAQDYAAVFGGDMASAVTKFGRALSDPKEGLTVLARKFSALDTAQRASIATMFESGRELEAQAKILDIVEASVGGAGAAAGTGLAGALDTLGEKWRFLTARTAESTGALSKAATVINSLANAFQNAANLINPSDQTVFTGLSTELMSLERELAKLGPRTMFNALAQNRLMHEIMRTELALGRLRDAREKEQRAQSANLRASEKLRESRIGEKLAARDLAAALKAEAQVRAEIAKVTQANLTPQEVFIQGQERLQKLLSAGLDVSSYERAMGKLRKALSSSQKIAGLDEVERSLLNDEEKLGASYDRRRAIMVTAIDATGALEIAKRAELYAALKSLDDMYVANFKFARLQINMSITQNAASVLSSLASIEQTNSQQMLERVNRDAERRTEIVQEQLDKGVLSEAEANSRIKKIESDRRKNSEAGAKKSFEASKKMQRAAAIMNTAAAVTLTLSDPSIPTWYARVAAAAATGVAGVAQVAAINSTSFSSGGSAVGAPGVGGSAGGAPGQLPQLPNEDRGSVKIQFLGDMYGWDEYMEERVISGIRDAVDNRDVTLIGRGSRQAQELAP